jgi:uncharacterized protein
MKNMVIVYIVIVVVLVFLAVFFRDKIAQIIPSPFPQSASSASVKIGDQTFPVELADDEAKREIGLSQKDSLGENNGMLFVFDAKGKYSFWMRDMKFNIDIIYIDETSVVDIYKNVEAPKSGTAPSALPIITSDKDANYVLEINAGTVDKYSIKEGDKVEITGVKK